MIEKYCRANIEELSEIICQLSENEYQHASELLSGSSIGQHIRHIAEFYLCLIKGSSNKLVNYDKRKRDLQLESDIKFALHTLNKIKTNLPCGTDDFPLTLAGSFSNDANDIVEINSSYFRELAYCLEHSIHHQALIKIGLMELDKKELIHADFGVAPATIRFKSV